MNLKLKEDLITKNNQIRQMGDQIELLKRTVDELNSKKKLKDQLRVVDNYVFEPDQDIMEVLRRQFQGEEEIK